MLEELNQNIGDKIRAFKLQLEVSRDFPLFIMT